MGDVLMFPRKAQQKRVDVANRHLSATECRLLGQVDMFGGFTRTLDEWFQRHGEVISRDDRSLQALLDDTWMLYSGYTTAADNGFEAWCPEDKDDGHCQLWGSTVR